MMIIRALTVLLSTLLLISGVACADEAVIRSGIAKKFPNANVESVIKTQYLGLYEVVVDGQLFYADENFNYLIDGNIIDTNSMTNMTAVRQRDLEEVKLKKLAFPFEQLPFEMAIKKVKGNGSRKIAVFSDPDCPFCRRLERDLVKLDNVTIYIFLYPLVELHPKAPDVSRAIWCSAERVKAWDEYMLNGVAPKAAGTCANPVDKLVEFGKSKRITGTPTIFFADGKRVPGAIPVERIEEIFAKAQTR